METIVLSPLRHNNTLTERWAAQAASMLAGLKVRVTVSHDETAAIIENLLPDAEILRVAGWDGEGLEGSQREASRVNYIGRLYEELFYKQTADRVLLWEDDVQPPPSGFSRLMETLDRKTQAHVAGVVSLYPFREFDPGTPASMRQWTVFDDRGIGLFWAPAHTTKTFQVFGGGTGFSLWRFADLVPTHPWNTTIQPVSGNVPGWDWGLALKLFAAQKLTLANGLVRCLHGE